MGEEQAEETRENTGLIITFKVDRVWRQQEVVVERGIEENVAQPKDLKCQFWPTSFGYVVWMCNVDLVVHTTHMHIKIYLEKIYI